MHVMWVNLSGFNATVSSPRGQLALHAWDSEQSAANSPPPSTVHERLQASVTATKHVALRHCGTGAGARLLISRIAGLQVLCLSMACVNAPRPRDDNWIYSVDDIHHISECPAVINSVNASTLVCLCWFGEGGDRDTQRSGIGGVAGGSLLRCGGEGTQRRAQAELPYDVVFMPSCGGRLHLAGRYPRFEA